MTTKRKCTMSLLWMLDRDVLHCLYSEWLTWRNLLDLDIACVGDGDRPAFLSSLSHLRMTRAMKELSSAELSKLYAWLGSREVFLVEGFPVKLTVLADLLEGLNADRYCPALRSITIDNYIGSDVLLTSDILAVWNKNIRLFLRQCCHLVAVEITAPQHNHKTCQEVDNLVLLALSDELKSNSLTRLGFFFSTAAAIRLLSKHCATLKELVVYGERSKSRLPIDDVLVFLLDNKLPLRRLSLVVKSFSIDLLLDYLASSGSSLESLEVDRQLRVLNKLCVNLVVTDEVLTSIGRACRKLRTLELVTSVPRERHQMRKTAELFQLCPALKTFSVMMAYDCVFIEIDDVKRIVCFGHGGGDGVMEEEVVEDWLECLGHIVETRQYSLLTSNTSFCDDLVTKHHTWSLVKSKLSRHLVNVEGIMSEAVLLDVLKEFPRLQDLCVDASCHAFSDCSLEAICQHGLGLKILWIYDFVDVGLQCRFSDEMISTMIEVCKQLENLKISGAGCKTVLAAKNHARLREVYLDSVRSEESAVKALLLHEEGQKWSLELRRGVIAGQDYCFRYNLLSNRRWR